MELYTRIKPLVNKINALKRKGVSIGFVPTMGYLHEGHLSLIRQARKDTDLVVVSIFVNLIQFGPKEDFKKYPRDFKRDLKLCRETGVDIVFKPEAKNLYPDNFATYVNVEGQTDRLCGGFRAGHFKGVTTIVTKLFNIVKPDIAYFGQKDAQQSIIIRKVVDDLNIGIKIKVMPIVREKDGLAMSSRNVYLSFSEREKALSIYKSLKLAKRLCSYGETASKKVIDKMRALIDSEEGMKMDYVSIVDTNTLKDVQRISGSVLVAVAVWVGKTRLIDNVVIK